MGESEAPNILQLIGYCLSEDYLCAQLVSASSLRSIILQYWDFDPAQRPLASRILQCITIPSKAEARLGASEDQEEGTSSLHSGDDSGPEGVASQEQTCVASYRAHTSCMNCQQNPKVPGQDFCSGACLDNASSRHSAGSQKNASSQRTAVLNLSNLSSPITAKLKTPRSIPGGFNRSTGELAGLPKQQEPTLRGNGIACQDQEQNSQDLTSVAQRQAKHASVSKGTSSREKAKQNKDSGARTGSFNTLIQGVLEDSQPFIHQHQPSIIKKILSIGRFRLPKTLAQAPFPPLPSAQYRRKDVSATTGDDSPPTGTDITHFEFSGQAAGWGETIPIPPPLARRQTHRSARPHIVVGSFNPPEIAGQLRIPPLPSPRSRQDSSATQLGEALESHRPSSASTDADKKFPLEIEELQDGLSSASAKLWERIKSWDCSDQLMERTTPKYIGHLGDVSQAKLGDLVVAVKPARISCRMGRKLLAREIFIWAALDHPNVLELLGFAIVDGGPCLISPWCHNGTLSEYLQGFPDTNRRRLVREIAEGLRYLHLQTPPIIHGDLTTTKVFITRNYVAKISDIGTYQRVDLLRSFPHRGLTYGLRYTAPEILRDGQHPILPSDVFSFACVALETMTDKCPFWKIPNVVAVITEVVFKRQTPSLEDYPGIENIIWELLRVCWNYEPSDRPNMSDVCQTLFGAG